MQLNEDKMDALVNDCLKITEGRKHPFSKDSHVWTDMEAVVNLVLERAQADARPVGWWYSDKTGEHFSKRGPDSYAPGDLSEYEVKVTPLYTHPEASAPGLNKREIADTVNKVRDIALQFHATQQLRGRIARVLVPILTRTSAATVGEVSDTLPVPVEKLRGWLNAFSEEMTAYDIDPPIYHLAESAKEIQAILDGTQQVALQSDVWERDSFFAGVCVSLACVLSQDSGMLWREIVHTVGEDDLLQYAAHVEPEEWELAGFARYAKGELGRDKPRKRAKPKHSAPVKAAQQQAESGADEPLPLDEWYRLAQEDRSAWPARNVRQLIDRVRQLEAAQSGPSMGRGN